MTEPAEGGTRPLVVVSRFLPDATGPAPARLLHGFVVGARSLGREVKVRSWWPEQPVAHLAGVDWEPLPRESRARMKTRALLRPRSDVLARDWRFPPGAVVVADELLSAPAVVGHPRSVVTVHYATVLDAAAVPAHRLQRSQDRRAERRAINRAAMPTAYSDRVAAAVADPPLPVVPAAIHIPAHPLPIVDEPVAACVADWRWPPNQTALRWLLTAWPQVRAQLPGAHLLLAGYGSADVGRADGVEFLGTVADSAEVLAQAAVLAFPCPPTSGPKVKVLEAMATGLPVVTTGAGVEGLAVGPDAVTLVSRPERSDELALALAGALRDPAGRATRAKAARSAVIEGHAPAVAAAARLALYDEAFG